MDNLFLNIIIPCYNAEKTIGFLLTSILNQTYQNFHITIVDDMSTDNSISEINKFISSNKITLLQNKVKCYQGKSRNIGFKNVKYKSEYVWFIDADDYLPNENVISNLYNIVKDIKYDIVSFQYIIDNNGKLYKTPIYSQKLAYDKEYLLLNCTVAPWSKIVKTKNIIDFVENTQYGEDAIWTLQLFDNTYNVLDISNVFYVYRVFQKTSVSDKSENNIDMKHQFTKSLENILPYIKNLKSKINVVNLLIKQYKTYGVKND